MFGGKLQTNHIQPLNDKNCLLAAFSNQLYIFDLAQTFIISKIQLSQNIIITWKLIESSGLIVALDQTGTLIEAKFNNYKTKQQIWYKNVKITTKKITNTNVNHGIITTNELNSSFSLYFIKNNDLCLYQNGTSTIVSKSVQKILNISQQHIICSQVNSKCTIKVISLHIGSCQVVFIHPLQISSALTCQSNLIIGDIKGKIYIFKDYLQTQKQSLHLATKLQWHVHRVNHMVVQGEYLYTTGEEGTVVMWHLRENNRDFLPRIGTEIKTLQFLQGIVYCLLADDTISSIDLNNDKQLRHYKTLVNPFGFLTKSIYERGFDGKKINLLSSQNNRNLMLVSGLPGSLQLLNLKDGSNKIIQILQRNLISRLDQNYPQPHDIQQACMNKQWTSLCCSSYGINHNFLHFYKNQSYNQQYIPISKVQNPHKGPISILSYNNIFITFSQNQIILRFWNKITKNKKSIIDKQEEFFVCSGEINYRNKRVLGSAIIQQDHLLIVNYGDQLVIVDLQKRQIQTAYKSSKQVQTALLVKTSKNSIIVIIVTKINILAFDLDRSTKQLKNPRKIYTFQDKLIKSSKIVHCNSSKLGILIKYQSTQVIMQYNLLTNLISLSLQNIDLSSQIVSICYSSSNLICLTSSNTLQNLSNSNEIITFRQYQQGKFFSVLDQQTSVENQSFQVIHNHFLQRSNARNRPDVVQCLEKIQLDMYPNNMFAFDALCYKMFI